MDLALINYYYWGHKTKPYTRNYGFDSITATILHELCNNVNRNTLQSNGYGGTRIWSGVSWFWRRTSTSILEPQEAVLRL